MSKREVSGKHMLPRDGQLSQKDGKKIHSLKSWGLSLAANIVIFLLILKFTDLFYETNDDYAIAERIANGYPYIGFVSYYLCKFLVLIQSSFDGINIFVVSQLFMSLVSFTAILKIVFDRCETLMEGVVAIAVVVLFSFDHYSSIQFTKTAAILMTAGLILLVDTFIHERRIIGFISSFALFYIGVAYRQKGMFPALAYAGVFVILWWLINWKQNSYTGRRRAREIALVISITVIAVIPYGLDLMSDAANASTPELEAARVYQAARVKITDYPTYDYYEANKDAYEEAGFSENDIYMLDRWILDYDGVASYDNLVKVNEINYPQVLERRSWESAAKRFLKKSYNSVKGRSFTGLHIVLLIALSLCMLQGIRPKNWLYIFCIGGLTVGIYVTIYYFQRAQYRAFYVADAGASFWLMYALVISDKSDRPYMQAMRNMIQVLLAALICVLVFFAHNEVADYSKYVRGTVESDAVAEFFENNPDNFYIGPTTTMRVHKSYLDPLHIPCPEANVADTGGWETLTPYKLETLKKYGIDNPVRDLIDNDEAFFFGGSFKKELTEYFNKWYGNEDESIMFVKIDEVDGNGIYKVVTSQNR